MDSKPPLTHRIAAALRVLWCMDTGPYVKSTPELHTHETFMVPDEYEPIPVSIDEIVKRMYHEYSWHINQLRKEMDTIHDRYREITCTPCFHQEVCSKRHHLKYGEGCEQRATR